MSAHTPGPWAVCDEPPNEYWYKGLTIGVADPGDARRVCDVHDWGLAFGDEMTKANAHLIAAAPDLLAACEFALAHCEDFVRDQLEGTSMLNAAMEKLNPIRAAIAKAKGGAK